MPKERRRYSLEDIRRDFGDGEEFVPLGCGAIGVYISDCGKYIIGVGDKDGTMYSLSPKIRLKDYRRSCDDLPRIYARDSNCVKRCPDAPAALRGSVIVTLMDPRSCGSCKKGYYWSDSLEKCVRVSIETVPRLIKQKI